MTLSKSITSMIADASGNISQSFLSYSAEQWATDHMRRRYSATPPLDEDPPDHPAVLCYHLLLSEYSAVKTWFSAQGQLSPLLMSRHLAHIYIGSLGDGFGWDFRPNGEPEPNMLQFKGTLIHCRRSLELRAGRQTKKDCGSLEIGATAKLVRSAYTARSSAHAWTSQIEGKGDAKRVVQAAELSRRWVAFRSYSFLIQAGAEEGWAWGASKCQEVFGKVDLPPTGVGL